MPPMPSSSKLTERDISYLVCTMDKGATTKDVFADSRGYVITITGASVSLLWLFGDYISGGFISYSSFLCFFGV